MTPHLSMALVGFALFFVAGFLFGRWCYKLVVTKATEKDGRND